MLFSFRYLDAAGDAAKVLAKISLVLEHLTETRLGHGFGSKLRKSLVKAGKCFFCESISHHMFPCSKLTGVLGACRV